MKRKHSLFLLLPAIAMVASSCDLFGPKDKVDDEDNTQQTGGGDDSGGGEDEVVHVTGIRYEVSKYSIEVGETLQIGLTFTPENATNKAVTYKATKDGQEVTDIVSITSGGLVTGLKEGSVKIEITSVDTPSIVKSFNLTVIKKAVAMPAATKDGYAKLTSTESLKNGEIVNIAGVIGDKIYGLGPVVSGTYIAPTELSVDGDALDVADDLNYTVVKNLDNSFSFMDKNGKFLMIDGSGNVLKGQEFIDAGTKFTVSVDADGNAMITGTTSSFEQKYLSLNPNNGNPRWACYKQSTATGYAKYAIYHNGVEAQPVAATGVELLQDSYEVQANMQVKVGAKVLPADATDKEITYSLRDVSPAGCAVIFNNVITGVAAGSATVVATSHDGSHEDTATLTVIDELQPEHAGTLADPFTTADAKIVSDKLGTGKTSDTEYYIKGVVTSLIEAFNPSFGNYTFWLDEIFEGYRLKNGSEKQSFSEGDLEVGDTVTIFAKIQNYQGTPENKDGYIVSIEKSPVESVSLDKSTLSMEAGSAPQTLVATVSPANAVNKEVVWSSSNETVATVVGGVVTPLAVGEATITAKSAGDASKFAECVVTVTAATRTMIDISVEGPTKTTYSEGEALDLTGLVVKAVYDSGDPEVISIGYETSIANGATLALTDTSLVVTYSGFTKTITLTVNEAQPIVAPGYYYISSIAGETTYYLKSNGTSSAPTAVTDIGEATIFKFTLVEGSKDTYKILLAEDNTKCLYATNTNNGLRVGSTDDTWKISEGTISGTGDYNIVDTSQSRYLSLYNNADFRSYLATAASSIKSANLTQAQFKEVSKIEVTTMPSKTTYYVGEAFDPTGMVVHVKYSDSTEEDITEGFTWAPKTFEATSAEKDITITYRGQNAHIKVAVIEDERLQTGIEFADDCDMTKKAYKENESWDAAGLSVKDVYDNGDKEDAAGVTYSFNPASPAVGVTSVTVTATKEGFDPVNKVITGITVEALPKNVDEITAATFTGLTNSYGAYSSNDTVVSDASYQAYAYKGSSSGVDNIQMRSSDGYFISKGSNRYVRKISVEFQKAGAIAVYARNQEFAGKADANATYLIGEIDGTTTELTITGDNLNFMLVPQASININKITVTYDEQKLSSFIDSVTLNKESLDINVGETETLTATVNGFGENYEQVNWTSSNTEVLTVDGGVLIPVAASETPVTITATSVLDGTKSATCQVTVKAARSFTELTTTGGFKTAYTTDDEEFEIDNLVVVANYSDDSTEVVTDYTVTWSDEFDNTVGSHSSTPTIHWDGHDQELSAVSYTVAQAAATKTATIAYTGSTTGNMDGTNQAALLGCSETAISVVGAKTNGGSNNVGLNKAGQLRLYSKESCTLTISITGGTINKLDVALGGTFGGLNCNGSAVSDAGANKTVSIDINGNTAAITNPNSSSTQTYIVSIVITYTLD